ncbi:MAG TPA: DUF1294 domain-containing protein [Bauldia sp.]|nr:DUF1294 domain-containing protein [Bauldia sp.]
MIVAWVALVSVVTFGLFGIDKRAAGMDAWRIPERTLLGLALVGGSPGAIIGQHVFRHKTRKEPFRTTLYVIVALQLVALGAWLKDPHLLADFFRYRG